MVICPTRCFTCGKVLSNKWNKYSNDVKNGVPIETALNTAGLKRYCCRTMMMTHVELIDELLEYSDVD